VEKHSSGELAITKKPKTGIRKDSFNMIRTVYRNNIDLTNIADNKANILLSLNSLMLTFLIPIVLSNINEIILYNLYLPLVVLSSTCIVTIILAAVTTRPIKMGQQGINSGESKKSSPFFFGNYYKMPVKDYMQLLEQTINDPEATKDFVKLDLYFMGKGLGEKYSRIRNCYNVFMIGLVLAVISTVIVVIV
jgi:hypothetical protein